MSRRLAWAFCLALIGVMLPLRRADAVTYRFQAVATCESVTAAWQANNPGVHGTNLSCRDQDGSPLANGTGYIRPVDSTLFMVFGSFAYGAPDPPDHYCQAGLLVPPGTDVNYDAASGAMCTIGTPSCSLALNVGGEHSGAYTMTGDACGDGGAGLPDGEPKTVPEPPEPEPQPGGGQKVCDEISGTCITTKPPDPGPPAPPASSGGPNDTTTTTGHTTTPGGTTTTIINTTTTTGGGGTGGDGSGTGGPATSSSSTAVTQHPASSSSTTSECRGGACDVGNADGIMGAMYRPSSVTPASVYQGFAAQVGQSPMITAVSGFFAVDGVSGTCPTWHIPGNQFWGEAGFDFSSLCQPGILARLALAG